MRPHAEARRARLGRAAVGLVLTGALALGAPSIARASQRDPHEHDPALADPAPKHDHAGMQHKMMADEAAFDAALQPRLHRLNAATGDAKVQAMAAAIVELARQRATRRGEMHHMSQMMGDMHTMMARCPMMGGQMEGKPGDKMHEKAEPAQKP